MAVSYALRSEWIKLRTARANVVLILIAIGAPLALSILIAALGDFEFESSDDIFFIVVLFPTFVCAFLAAVLGVLSIGQEYRHHTIRVTFAAQPRRSVVLAAKCILNGLFGLYIGLFTPILCFGIGGLILKARDVDMSVLDPGVNLSALIGQALFTSMMALMGFGLGCIMRQPAGAIPVILVWPLILEGIVGQIFNLLAEGSEKWMPFRAGTRMGLNSVDDLEHTMSRATSGIYFLLWTVVVVALGWWLAERRDA